MADRSVPGIYTDTDNELLCIYLPKEGRMMKTHHLTSDETFSSMEQVVEEDKIAAERPVDKTAWIDVSYPDESVAQKNESSNEEEGDKEKRERDKERNDWIESSDCRYYVRERGVNLSSLLLAHWQD